MNIELYTMYINKLTKDKEMKQTITLSMFREAFHHASRKDNFSYDGLEALFNDIEENDPDYDLDVIGLCCAYTEYADIDEVIEAYHTISDLDELSENTQVIKFKSGLIVCNF